jgi:hypothetical protein
VIGRFGTSSSTGLDDDKSLESDESIESVGFSLEDFAAANVNNVRIRSNVRRKDIERMEVRFHEQIPSTRGGRLMLSNASAHAEL